MKKRGCSEKDEFVIVRGNTMSEGTQEMRQEKIEYFLAQAQQYHFTREYSKAMEFYIRAGLLGDKGAIRGVCEKLHNGYGMSYNEEELFRCMLTGAKQYGILEAMRKLARCYESGIGTEKNQEFADFWLEKSGLSLRIDDEE